MAVLGSGSGILFPSRPVSWSTILRVSHNGWGRGRRRTGGMFKGRDLSVRIRASSPVFGSLRGRSESVGIGIQQCYRQKQGGVRVRVEDDAWCWAFASCNPMRILAQTRCRPTTSQFLCVTMMQYFPHTFIWTNPPAILHSCPIHAVGSY